MRFSRQALIVAALLVVLCLVVILGVARSGNTSRERGSIYNSHSDGTQSLYRWLAELGYTVHALEQAPLTLSPRDRVLLVVVPSDWFTQNELRTVEAWVRLGGTLIVAEDDYEHHNLSAHYAAYPQRLKQPIEYASLRLPALNWPQVGQAHVRAFYNLFLGSDRLDAAVHMGTCDSPLLVSFGLDQGQVFVLSMSFPFTNAGLADSHNAQLIYNLMRASAPSGTSVAIDEVHHHQPPQVLSSEWLMSTPEGWGLVYGGGLLFLYLLLSGRRLGAPVASPQLAERRTSAEFITALAGLYRQTVRHTAILQRYKARLKRTLARPWRLDATLPDAEFVVQLQQYRNDLDTVALKRLLDELSHEQIGEAQVIHLVQQVAQWTAV